MRHYLLIVLAATLAFAGAARAADATWVQTSNANAQVLLKVMADFSPESAGRLGISGVDENIIDLRANVYQRRRAALEKALAELRQRLADTHQTEVRQDLQIMIDSAEEELRSDKLHHDLMLPYYNVPAIAYRGISVLLNPQVPAERQKAALVRLKKYAGSDGASLARLAEQRTSERFGERDLVGPYVVEVKQDLSDADQYLEGIKQLFEHSDVDGWKQPFEALRTQVKAYEKWVGTAVLAHARQTNRLPEQIYADNLRQVGVDIPPRELMHRAQAAFVEIQNQMKALAPLVAKQKGYKSTDYRDVIRQLKKEQITGKTIVDVYKKRLSEIEDIIRREHIVTLPRRAAEIRLASKTESAAMPAPHMQPPPLIGNTGQRGQFVLPLNTPDEGGKSMKMDDFTFDAMSWSLISHEARPGHELQFASMVEKGVSLARAEFAFNSANVEGWALYSEAEMQPYEPLDGQLMTLNARLMRAARAFVDPMLNLGLMKPEQAREFIMREMVLSPALAKEEIDRYTFRAPGQATSYFYGYTRLMQLRGEAQVALGDKFNRQHFNDFVLSQGLLPPDLMQKAIEERFIPEESKL
ncbi:MAG: DUF885 domain-containing protein [Gammaproteobacteria bacterium]